MARNYPVDTMMQKALEERYETETKSQIAWFLNQRKGAEVVTPDKENNEPKEKQMHSKDGELMNEIISNLEKKIEQTASERDVYEKEVERNVCAVEIPSNETKLMDDMRPPSANTKKLLYHGISKEGKGRLEYLTARKKKSPEDKYDQPIISSMEYGWKLNDTPVAEFAKPKHGRTKLVEDTFYTRTGIPIRHYSGKNIHYKDQ
ncbi:hypothetical protein Ciccas_007305 [Cichlidogyrus casuarinus]|uniref:Sperm microtubule inner protein 1 C-terminal domain-containing protein n=1 Tax=Cichlidogyrus casuarinus TaxID=1844966 RepID=A0ABD2Q397_9PLAT